MNWVQTLLGGILIGGVYALVAVGMTLTFAVTRILNFAQGAFVAAGMYASYVLSTMIGMNAYLALVVIAPVFLALGSLLYVVLIDQLLTRPPLMQLTFTLGLLIILQSAFEVIWNNSPVRVRAQPFPNLYVGTLYLPATRLVAFAAAVSLSFGIWQFLKHARLGRAVRAAAEHPRMAELVGIPRRKTMALAFGLAASTAGLAGGLIAPFVTISPYVGESFLAASFAAVVVGTKGNVLGALIGGLVIGLAEAIGSRLLGDETRQAVFFGVVVLVLLVKPQGLFSRVA